METTPRISSNNVQLEANGSENQISNSSSVLNTDLDNPAVRFAKIQLLVAKTTRRSADDFIGKIRYAQSEQTLASWYLDKFENLKAKIKEDGEGYLDRGTIRWMNWANISDGGNYDFMSLEEISDYADEHGYESFVYDDESDVDIIIKSTEAYIDKSGSETQQNMVTVQDALGRYNAFIQGANSTISDSDETLKYLARGQ